MVIDTHHDLQSHRRGPSRYLFEPTTTLPTHTSSNLTKMSKSTANLTEYQYDKHFTPSHKQRFFINKWFPEIDWKVSALCCLWYVISSISSNLTKQVLKNFKFPVAFTEIQFLTSASLCLFFVTLANSNKSAHSYFPRGTLPEYLNGDIGIIRERFLSPERVVLLTTLPMGMFQFVGHITSHQATSLIPVSLVHSVKALSPLVTVIVFATVYRKRYPLVTYATLVPLITGVIITCFGSKGKATGSVSGFLVGIFFAFVSMIIFVSQNIFAKKILTVKQELPSISKEDKKIDKLTILFYCSVIGFGLTLPVYVYSEISSGTSALTHLSWATAFWIFLHGVSHFFQAMLAFHLIGVMTPVNYSIANIMKRIVVILVAMLFEGHLGGFTQTVGVFLTVFGLYAYDKWGIVKS